MRVNPVRSTSFLGLIVVLLAGAILSPRPILADSFDWRNVNGVNWVTPVRDQGGWGTCWDFAACGALEAKYMLTRNDMSFQPDVSEEQSVNAGVGGINGGWPESCFNYFKSTGVVSEAELPYGEQGAPYWPLQPGWENRVWKSVSNSNCVTNTTENYKAKLRAYGPMSTCLDSNVDLYVSVADMVEHYRAPASYTNHAVLLVGYVDDASIQTGGYWIIKNSWGDYRGDHGYDYVPYGSLEIHNYTSALDRGVYYTGPMAAATWNGGSGTWSLSGTNWTSIGNTYAWENKETTAAFGGTGGTVTIAGKVIAHGMTIDSGSSYTFTGGSLTVTSGGITANSSVAINSPVTIGGGGGSVTIDGVVYNPQVWNVAGGSTLTVNADLHTVVSDVMFGGAGNTILNGAIDGGGVINDIAEGGSMSGGAKPGRLIQNGTGTLTLQPASGALNFGGDIVVGAGTLRIDPMFSLAVTLRGAICGSGAIAVNSSNIVSLGGGASNFSGSILMESTGPVNFIPAAGVVGTFSGPIQGSGRVVQNGPGTTIFSGSNSYTGRTQIVSGALQADDGVGLPSGSFLSMSGGVLQGNSTTSFTRSLGTTGGAFQMSGSGGGFAAGGGTMTVNIGGSATPSTVVWGTAPADVGSKIVGTLMLNSTTATSLTDFRNPINLNGADRSIQVDDNPSVTTDYASMSGAITYGSGTAGIVKTGDGLLVLNATNNYNGSTMISGGALQATINTNIPSGSLLKLDGGVLQGNGTGAVVFSRSLGTGGGACQFAANGGGFSAGAGTMTVNIGGLSTPSTLIWGTTVGSNIVGTLKLGSTSSQNQTLFRNSINLNGADRTIQVDSNPYGTGSPYSTMSGSITNSTGTAGIVKTGKGKLTLTGVVNYNGATTINGGTLDISGVTSFPATNCAVNGGTTSYSSALDIGSRAITVAGLQLVNASVSGYGGTLTSLGDCNFQGNGSVNTTLVCNGGMTVSGTGTFYMWYKPTVAGLFTLQSGGLNWQGSSFANADYVLNGGQMSVFVEAGTYPIKSLVLNGAGISVFYPDSTTLVSSSTYDIRSGTIDIALGGSVGLTKSGSGSVDVNRRSTYTGTTTVQDGYLVFKANAAPMGSLVVNGGNLTFYGPASGSASVAIGPLQLNGGTVWGGGVGGLASIATYDLRQGQINAKIGGSVGLTKTTSGAVFFYPYSDRAYDNAYTGPTTISGGTLIMAEYDPNISNTVSAALPAASLLRLDGGVLGNSVTGATFTRSLGTSGDNKFLWTLNGGGFAATASTYNVNIGGGGTLTWGNSESDIGSKILGALKFGSSDSRCNSNVVFQNPINLNGADRTIFVDDNPGSVYNQYNWYDHAEMTGAISNGTGTAGLVKTGPGELELQGENTYNGTTTVLGGTLSYSAASAMSGGAYMLSGGTLNTAALSKTIGAFQINGGTVTGTGTLTSTAAYDLQSGTVDVNLGGSVGLNKATSGSVSFTRSLPAGNYSISDGTLNLNGLTKTIGTFRITGGTVTGTSSLTSTAAYDLQNGTVDVALGGSVGLNKTTSGSVLLTKTLPSGNYSISDGMLNINSQSKSISSFLISGGTISGAGSLTASSTYSVQGGVVDVILAGSLRTLTKSGTGTATLSRANTYTGQTNVNAGKLQIRHVNALGTTAGKTVVASGAVLSVGGGLTGTINEPIDLNGSGDGNGALQSLDAGTDVTFAGPINLVSNAGIGGTSHIAISGNVTGAGGLSKYGSNRVNLNGNNSYVGRTTVASGTLELGSAAQNAVFTLGGADIQLGKMVFDYNGASSPGATILNLLTTSCHGGLWDVGQFRDSTALASGLTLGWFDNGSSAVTVMATYAGDFNLDGSVDLADLNVWKANIGIEGPGTKWQLGDANYDGQVDGLDLDMWKSHLGMSVSAGFAFGSSNVAVPEPGTLAMLAAALCGLLGCVWRRRLAN